MGKKHTIRVVRFRNGNQGMLIPYGTIERVLSRTRALTWAEGFCCSRVKITSVVTCRVRGNLYQVTDRNDALEIHLASDELLPKDLVPFPEEDHQRAR
jgi:hypothetical protein